MGMISNSFSDFYKKILIDTENKIKDIWLKTTIEFDVFMEILKQSQNNAIWELFSIYWINEKLVLEIVSKTGFSHLIEDRKWVYTGMEQSLKDILLESVKIASSFSKPKASIEDFILALISSNSWFNRILDFVWINPSDLENHLIDLNKSGSVDWKIDKNTFNAWDEWIEKLLWALTDNLMWWWDDGIDWIPNINIDAPHEKQKWKDDSMTPVLDFFASDLTSEAKNWEIWKVIWRETEIERLIAIINRKTKNNPVLVWEPGTWKTAVVEWLAQRIAEGTVPFSMKDKKIMALDMSSLVAWTKYRWEFENRIKQIIEEASKAENEVVLFIDEIHTIIWAGGTEWSLDASNILKPAMWRWKIRVIWATTLNEYQKYIEKDAALERRFQRIAVDEPNYNTALEIISWIKESFEEYHNLIITDEAVEEAVKLSTRYITDRFLPDKAIDLVDEACSLKSMKYNHNEEEVQKIKEQIVSLNKRIENSVIAQHYKEANRLKEEVSILEKKIQEKKRKFNIPREKRFKVTPLDIQKVLSIATGIPVTDLNPSDISKLKNLPKKLKKYIIGQDDAVKSIVSSIMRSKAGIASEARPVWSFLFLGPTWVGKTELVKVLAREFYGDEKALIKIDMSEYNDKTWVNKLIWASAWYVWYEEWWLLTEKVRKKPYSVVLFDEIEKADFEIYNLLLQILEEWRLTDSKWREVNFKNTVIIMTSNIGQEEFNSKAEMIWFNVTDSEKDKIQNDFEKAKNNIIDNLTNYFAPEFINRVDKTIVFNPLDKKIIRKIVILALEDLENRLKNKNLEFTYDDKILPYITKEVYNPEFWAREVRRYIQDNIEDEIANILITKKKCVKIHLSKDKFWLKITSK